ncbi:hypothetical protein [Lewinella sp. W8]|uniref:hypothetical protein n=1 Tax=Lewinella sp. W8 TaxID=2528208 RepID=UPI00106891F4|nr:hypothetical protein [Lewinella sp. W8]MTB53080.1 hypothetical protein [Lewinella sp. W8]
MRSGTSAYETAQLAALRRLDLPREARTCARFFRDYYFNHPDAPYANRDQLQEVVKIPTTNASRAMSNLKEEGVIFDTDKRRGRQDCCQYEPDPEKWATHRQNYLNRRKHRRAEGILNDFGHTMDPKLREMFQAWGRQSVIV